jgi:hypothetical protein
VIGLLVITSTLTILAAILFPAFAQAGERARQVGCLSNLRQLSAAMRLYNDENDGAFPPELDRHLQVNSLNSPTRRELVQHDLHSSRVLADPTPPSAALGTIAQPMLSSYGYPSSMQAMSPAITRVNSPAYGCAYWEGVGGFTGPPVGNDRQPAPSRIQAGFARSAETILLCDHRVFDWGLAAGQFFYPEPRHFPQPRPALADGSWVPQGQVDAPFVDGHVRAVRHEQLWERLEPPSARTQPWGVFRYFWPEE